MKYFIASDIHGYPDSCEKILAAYDREQADRLILLGDILYFGPRNPLGSTYDPKGVIALLNARKEELLCVRGNCDSDVDQMVLEFPIMADYIYIMSGETVIFATHGHKYNPLTPPVALPKDAVLLCGHTHIAADEKMDGFRYMNPGSPSIPKNGSKPSYIVIEDGVVELKEF